MRKPNKYTHAIELAREAFFASLAQSFPTVETGDLDAGAHFAFLGACEDVALAWIEANVPEGTAPSDTGMLAQAAKPIADQFLADAARIAQSALADLAKGWPIGETMADEALRLLEIALGPVAA